MKKIVFILFLCIKLSTVQAQALLLDFKWTHTANHVALTYMQPIKQFEIGLGAKYFINSAYLAYSSKDFFHRALNTGNHRLHHFGLNGFLRYNMPIKRLASTPFIMYHCQWTYAGTKRQFFYNKPGTENYGLAFKEVKPMHVLEQHIAVGLKSPINKRFFANISAGAGVATYFNNDMTISTQHIIHRFSLMYQGGIVYLIHQ